MADMDKSPCGLKESECPFGTSYSWTFYHHTHDHDMVVYRHISDSRQFIWNDYRVVSSDLR